MHDNAFYVKLEDVLKAVKALPRLGWRSDSPHPWQDQIGPRENGPFLSRAEVLALLGESDAVRTEVMEP